MAESVDKAYKSLTDIKKLMIDEKKLPSTSLEEILTSKHLSVLNDQLKIIDKYRAAESIHSFARETLQEDLIKISALNVYTGMVAGYLNGAAFMADEEVKLAKSKAAYAAKSAKEELEAAGDIVKLTDKDVETLSRIRSQNIVADMSKIKAASETVKFSYYAIQEFIESLKATLRTTMEK